MAKMKKTNRVKNPKKTGYVRDAKGRFFPGGTCQAGPGRPRKENCIPDILNKILDEEVDIQGKRMTKREAILRGAVKAAGQGDKHARDFIADRSEGKAVDRIIRKDGTIGDGVKTWREVVDEYTEMIESDLGSQDD